MTIEKGQAWGRQGAFPADGILVSSDREARAIVEQARRAGDPVPTLGLLGGDLCRTCGGTGDAARIEEGRGMLLPVDLGAVLIDGKLHWFVAHLVARNGWWRGRVVAAMNAQFLGPWDVAPRSHPNDGRLDVFDGDLSLGDRAKARSRLPLGTHVPHPGILESRVSALQLEFARPTQVWLDGVRVGAATKLSIRTEADAITCVV